MRAAFVSFDVLIRILDSYFLISAADIIERSFPIRTLTKPYKAFLGAYRFRDYYHGRYVI